MDIHAKAFCKVVNLDTCCTIEMIFDVNMIYIFYMIKNPRMTMAVLLKLVE